MRNRKAKSVRKVARVAKDKTLVGFKVVRKVGKRLMSSSSKFLKVEYKRGEFVKPRTYGGPLSLFANVYEAIGSIKKLPEPQKVAVYSCEYVPTNCNVLFRFAEGRIQVRELDKCPEGTILALKIKLLRRVF